ncbi:RhoGEF GTPase [Aspergillus cavernicola]|uniref:RhoGEF GTPase n=1 Tax=Aspergillus cavernicola TaxID=176166 RepID=A0ABR4IAQ2_9EURO
MADTAGLNGGPVAEDNIINRRGNEGIYQSCVNLKKRLAEVPGFEPYLLEMDEEEMIQGNGDPVASLWNFLRHGYPLLAIYNASRPDDPLKVDTTKVPEARRPKAATFKFLQAAIQELAFPQQECFLITDLYGENTIGFTKVIKMVNRVLDILEMQGQLKKPSDIATIAPEAGRKLTRREHILKELLETERDYVHHLQNLQALKKELEDTGALTGDASHQIFLNLNNLLDFAQRFLIRLEQHYALPEERQNWGELFTHHEEAFHQYEPFIANQMRCDQACQKDWDKIQAAPRSLDLQQMVAQQATLNGFFVKPFQRLTKYPLMLSELRKQMEDPDLQADILRAIDAIQIVLDSANDAIDKEQLGVAFKELDERVDDWKALKIDTFGDLLRYGTFIVIKGDNGKDSEREYHIYLFERILLCCKDINPNKQKSRLVVGSKDKPSTSKGKPRLQLKGRIYMANVTDIVWLQKPGSYRIQIFWKGDPGVVDNFVIRYQNENIMRQWYKDINHQRESQAEQRSARNTGTSETEFTYLKSLTNIPNPYQQEYDAEEQATKEAGFFSEFPMSRNASSTSLRTRSATGGSGSSGPPLSTGRARYPALPDSTLSVHTQFPGGSMSPAERNASSYFSPVAETPSTRSSSQSAGYFNRQLTPATTWSEDSNRYTAPALSRATSRDGPNSNTYFNGAAPNGRSAQRPSLPPMSGHNQTPNGAAQQRLRSASSPDIHHHNSESRRYMGAHTMQTVDNVPVPPIPAHMANMKAPVSRSQNNSPTNHNLPIRTAPNAQIHHPHTNFHEPQYTDGRPGAPVSDQPTSPLSHEPDEEPFMPTQLKAKVNFDENYVTLVISSNIMFRTLTDRVDAKLARFTNRSIGNKTVRLRYRDEDGDFVTIDSDEAVQLAFMEWRDQHREMLSRGQVGEIQLYCQVVEI